MKKNCLFVFQNTDDLEVFIDLKIANQSNVKMIRGNGVNASDLIYQDRKYENKVIFLYASRLVLSKGILEFINASRLLKENTQIQSFILLEVTMQKILIPYHPKHLMR